MTKLKSDEIIKQGNNRIFRQSGGPLPNNAYAYSGVQDDYLAIQGVTGQGASGGVDPIYRHDPYFYGKWRLVGRTNSPPELPTASIMVNPRLGRIPFPLQDLSCPSNFYIPSGKCRNPSDFERGWSNFVWIFSEGEPSSNPDLGDLTSWDSDDPVEFSTDYTFSAIYAVAALGFGDNAAALIDREVIDAVYGSRVECGLCGPQDNGSKKIYAVTKSSGGGSPGIPSELIYTLDGGANWSQATITGIGATEDALAIAVVGQYLLVLGDGAYYYAELNSETGAPGSFTKVTSGFVGANDPLDVYVLSPSEIFFSAQGGYIYKSTDITGGVSVLNAAAATTANLNRINGDGDNAIVAVGVGGAVIKSTNRGNTFSTTTTAPSADDNQALAVLDERTYWVGDDAGGRYYTVNAGETWVAKSIAGAIAVTDIVFATSEVGYTAFTSAGPAGNLQSTWNGGYSWMTGSPRILGLPVSDKIGRIAVPTGVHPTTASNYVALAALAGTGTDGALFIGSAPF